MDKIKFDFGWGNPHFLLELLANFYYPQVKTNIKELIYGPYEGTQAAIDASHQVIKQTTTNSYRHILITNGAGSAINMLLRRFKANGGKNIYTTQYGYPSYEEMIKRAGLRRIRGLDKIQVNLGLAHDLTVESMRLIDSPDNPMGEQFTGGDSSRDVWDGVYHNKIYTQRLSAQPEHKFFVGSYSKLLGVAGARIGFIATDDSIAYEALLAESLKELTGVSRPSQDLVVDIIKKLDLDLFMTVGNSHLSSNKTEFQKIEYLFDGQKVNEIGMFYCAKADPKAVNVLDRAGVGYVRLDEETIRLSMGQTMGTVNNGIKAILKEDGR
ncbi:MAG: aminotransferase class I/II-fold pyridoxal phosphate-dependent enzyme [Leptolyngbyaceae cyanobacterium RM2_2_4]|nr:aminotransferase class I/II-fold pyridoxal phosphate-dependent enzyme [Leptolyngbyaceae cyanobacterium RM2_2_4]